MRLSIALSFGALICCGMLCQPVAEPPNCSGLGDLPNGYNGATFQGLGITPDGDFRPTAVSGDGRVVVGSIFPPSAPCSRLDPCAVPGPLRALRWEDGAFSELLLPPGGLEPSANAVSRDGSVIVGDFYSGQAIEAFRWTAGDGIVGLGLLPGGVRSNGNGVSADGSVVTGQGLSTASPYFGEAFRWTQAEGLVGLGGLPGGRPSGFGCAVSADGSVIVGGSSTEGRSDAAFRWAAQTGMLELPDLPRGTTSHYATAVSADGSVVVGNTHTSGGRADSWSEAFRWTEEEGTVGLGDLLGGGYYSLAKAVSADGNTIVGVSSAAIIPLATHDFPPFIVSIPEEPKSKIVYEAFIWTPNDGMRRLRNVLVDQYGLNVCGWTLDDAVGISEDGLTIVGTGVNPDGQREAWIARLPSPSP